MSEFFSPYDADRPLMLKCSCGRDHTVADHHAEVSADAAAATLRQRSETRERLREQHHALFQAIIEGRAEEARRCSQLHIDYVQAVLIEGGAEAERIARAQRRQGG